MKDKRIDHLKRTLTVKRRIARFKKKELRISRFPIYKRNCFFCSRYFETPKKNKIYCSEVCRKLAEKVKNRLKGRKNIKQKGFRRVTRGFEMKRVYYFPLVFVLLFLPVSFADSNSNPIYCPPGQYYSSSGGCVNNGLEASPTSFGFDEVITGDTIHDTLKLTNNLTSSDLKFVIDVSWISVSPPVLTIAPQGSADFNVALTALPTNGTYSGNIKVYANNQLAASVPVVLRVINGNPLESNARVLLGDVGAEYLTKLTIIQLVTFADRTVYSLHPILLAFMVGAIFLYSRSYIPGAVIMIVFAICLAVLYNPILLG